MNSVSENRTLTGRTVLISPSALYELATELEQLGARVLTWPKFEPNKPESYAAIDEAIENIFGYDWLVLRNASAAHYFLRRFQDREREVSELDPLRVCAIGTATIARLEDSQVHLDVIPDLSSPSAFSAIEAYAGGQDSLGGLNFLVPCAAITSDSLTRLLEETGARVDEVTTYRTCSPSNSDLAQIKGLLTGGAIDCVVFTGPSDVHECAAVFDANDLSRLMQGVAVVCVDERATRAVADFGLGVDLTSNESSSLALACAVSEYLA